MADVTYLDPFQYLSDEQLDNRLQVATNDHEKELICEEIVFRVEEEGSMYWMSVDE